MTTPPPPETETHPPKVLPGWRRWLLTILSVLLLLTFIAITIGYLYSYPFVKYFVQSAAGQRVASTSLGRAIKVDGKFAPLHLDHWTITTDSFTSTGWPGEAIGGMNAYGCRIEFDPEAVWRGVWHINAIQIDRGQFILRTPNDALKRPVPPKKPKPWYAHFLPTVFQCGPITTPDANVDFEFQKQEGHIIHAPLQADLIGKDFRYTATGGTLKFPYLPPMHIDRLQVMVTRPLITFEDVELRSVDPADPARMILHGEMGQRADKTIKAIIDVTQMPIEQLLPPDAASVVHGRISGHLTWDRNQAGDDLYSDGELDMAGASIDDLSVFKVLTVLHGNPDLLNFTFDTLHLKFHMRNGLFTAQLVAVANGKFALNGTITYDLPTKVASIDAQFTELPLNVWLPSEFKPHYNGVATASLQWKGQLQTIKDSTANVAINLDGTHINNPLLLRRLLAKKKLRAPDEIDFKTAELNFAYQNQVFQLTRAVIDAPGIITASASGTVTPPDAALDATMTWSGLKLGNWLPPEIAEQIDGDINGGVVAQVHRWKLKDGSYAGDLQMVNGQLAYTSVQTMFARWVKDPRLLQIPLTRASLAWTWNAGALTVSNIDLRGGDDIGVEGTLMMSPQGALSGQLWIGTREKYLHTLMGLANAVFTRDAEGLHWAHVNVSGTAKHPQQDLSAQILGQLHQHPLAIFGLGGRLVSWYVGDWFGAGEEWKKPQPPNVVVGAR